MLLPILGVLVLLAMPVIAVIVSRRDRDKEMHTTPEMTEAPIDWGVGSQLPNGAIRTEPLFPAHPKNCAHCQHQAPGISAA